MEVVFKAPEDFKCKVPPYYEFPSAQRDYINFILQHYTNEKNYKYPTCTY